MGASTSRMEEDKALQLCRERKKFVRQALDGRCSLAAAHVSYVQCLKNTGTALKKFAEPEIPVETSLLYPSNATPEPTEKAMSHFHSSPSVSEPPHDRFSPSPSPSPLPPSSGRFQVNHMKFRGFSSKKVEEKPPVSVIRTVTSSSTPQTTTPQTTTPRSIEKPESPDFDEASPMPPESPPWDFFAYSHPIENELSSSHEGKERMSRSFENGNGLRHLRGEDGILEQEDEQSAFSHERQEDIRDSEDEFDEPSADTLVRSFENFNRVHDHNNLPTALPKSAESSDSEFSDEDKTKSPQPSPLGARTPSAATPVHSEIKRTPARTEAVEDKLPAKDLCSSMKEIEFLFIKASESGKEVPRMLEANKLHFRPLFPGKESVTNASSFLKSCFSCGEDHIDVQEEPAQNSMKYLTWHRTESSRSSSSRTPLGGLNSDDVEELNSNLFDNICMIAGSHASTLDRLYAWEKKLYDEVKASQIIRREYDRRCKDLRQLESEGISSYKIDKTRAVVKDLHSRIRIAIQRIDSISQRIEELRDKELQPQLEELMEGLSRMWEVMSECHKQQFRIIAVAYNNINIKINLQSESHRLIASYLPDELSSLASAFTKWIGAQRTYLQAINDWLFKCVALPQRSSKRKRRASAPPLRNYGPPIYVTCGVWLEKLDALPTKDVSDSIKALASDVARFLPPQEKHAGKKGKRVKSRLEENGSDVNRKTLQEEATADYASGFDRFRSGLEGFLGNLSQFSKSSVEMYEELRQAIVDAKNQYDQLKAYTQVS